MVDLILFSVSIVIIFGLVIAFIMGLYFSRGDGFEDGYCYFRYSYMVHCATHPNTVIKDKVVYAKTKKRDLRLYRTHKCYWDYDAYDLSHVTWITRREYEEATK